MIDSTQAVQCPRTELVQLFTDWSDRELRLEEVVTPLAEGKWRLTSSAANEFQDGADSLVDLLRTGRRRKIVELAAEEGDLIAITAA